ncbi:uncharacterized threonine-rich GPI-anchored glycoprotein PJ4664.02-like isoform X1 [Aricia agestis]|uniref:uncharacterized threonine-rich GPI-anchored glycoprotein PJ4664.02-like isoform X1 n=1 Tax=Aricia agestis TaxID=91739 RepID=UPI001C206EF0|nr:uncharacterized threonine-rich GPI-anchored glycoprotein PJ4664.02-like isoform X1 [Aricia agestis]
MRKTSHDGVDTTSITSGIENEVKKSSTTGIIKMKKSSIKRKVPNFSHESDDGIIEPLLQSDKDKSETAPRSAKYLLSKTKTDSISENEDSIRMSEINITYFSASTPTTAADKVVTATNMNDAKDSNNVSTGVTTFRNHMNTNVFCVSEASKGKMSTKSPLLVELDAAKTTGYSPSLIFTTAKIHSDCKTKLMEPIQVTPVPIKSTTEKDVEVSGSINSNKANVAGNSIIEKLNNISNKNDKLNLESDIRNNSTSKAILNLTEKSTNHKSEEYIPKNAVGNNISIKTGTKNTTINISNAKTVSEDLNIKNMEQTKQMQNISKQIESKGEIIEKIVSDNGALSSGSIKSEQTSKEKGDKKLIVQGSKKLQRQKKATVDEPQDSISSANIIKDKTSSDDKPTVSQTRTTTVTSTVPSTIATAKSQSEEKYSLKSYNIANNTTSQPIENSKISSQVGSIPKPTDSKVQTPVSKNVTQQPIVGSKIPSPVISPPKATDDKIQSELTKNLTLQSITNSKMPSQGVTAPKSTDSKIQTPVSKIPTPTCPVSNIVTKSTSHTTASKTIHDTGSIKIANSNKKEVKLDTINKNESPFVNKSSAKEISPVATEKSSPVTKTLPPYIVSTSKAKTGAPVVTSATLKSEVSKSSSDSKSPVSSHLVKMTPATNPKTLTSSVSTPVTSGSALKSEPKKLATNSKSSVNSYLVKTTPVSSLKTATTLSTPVVTSATLKSEPSKSASDSKNTKSSYSVKTTPAASLKSTTTTVPTPATTSATLKPELKKSASDSKSSTNSYSIKTTPATSLKTSTTTALPTTSSSSQGTKQSGPVKQTKTNTEKQKDGGKV